MLAGAGGIDLAMLVIAADEGVMPQTREHLGILTQLGISDGLVVLTKTDKVESDWMELVIDDITELVSDTFLESKEILPVSALTGDGIAGLRETLRLLRDSSIEKNFDIPFRLPVDRVFPVDGFGIVVTGTLIEGRVKVGDIAEIQPSGEKAPVRNIQVHGENAQTAHAGQRTAISLAGVKRGNVARGDVLSAEGMLNVSSAVDVKLNVLSDSKRTIKNGAELHLYHGARTILAKVFLLDKSELQKSESCYARLKLKEPLPSKRGDRFVVRFFSPMETIGGGTILDSSPNGRISRSETAFHALRIREQGSVEDIANLSAYALGGVFSDAELCRRADLDMVTCKAVITVLIEDGRLIQLLKGKYISAEILEKRGKECKETLEGFHKSYPLRTGMNLAELRQKLLPDAGVTEANALFKALEENGTIKLSDKNASLPDFKVAYTPVQKNIYQRLYGELKNTNYDVKSPEELSALFSKNEKRDFEQVFESMISSGELVMLSQQIYWLKDVYDNAIELTKTHFSQKDEITLAGCRDMLGTSRKYALTFLEHLDGKQVTSLQGDTRKLKKGFDAL